MDAIIGSELGADECIFKPFAIDELLARMDSVMGRAEGTGS